MYDIPNCGMVRKTGIFHGVGERRNHRIWDTQFSVPYDISSVWCLYIALAYHIWNLNISIYLDKLLLTCAWFDLLSADMIFVSLIYTYIYICIYLHLSISFCMIFSLFQSGWTSRSLHAISQERRWSKVVYNGSWNARSFFLCVHHIDYLLDVDQASWIIEKGMSS